MNSWVFLPQPPAWSAYPVLVVTGHGHMLLCNRIPPKRSGVTLPVSCLCWVIRGSPCEGQGPPLFLLCLLFGMVVLWGAQRHWGSPLDLSKCSHSDFIIPSPAAVPFFISLEAHTMSVCGSSFSLFFSSSSWPPLWYFLAFPVLLQDRLALSRARATC